MLPWTCIGWVPGFLHRSTRDSNEARERDLLHEDAALARELGFDAAFVESAPGVHQPAIRFAQQARIHPLQYLRGLLPRIQEKGGEIFEQTSCDEVLTDPLAVRANGKRIRCNYIVIATHNPLMGSKGALTTALFQTKISLYTSYVIGARLPPGSVPEALYWDTADPYDYLRIDPATGGQYAIFGGEDVKTGQEEDTEAVYQRLQRRLHELLPQATPEHRWMGQVIETDDGLPFIGEHADREFIATGFAGNGTTLGTIAAMMARDKYLGRENPWADLFRVSRKPFHGGIWRYLRENADYPYYMVRDRLGGTEGDSPDQVPKGEGRIIRYNGEKLAAYRSPQGELSLLSPVCTHLKCIVRWNSADSTWDCPCHGSRFRPTGEVMSGPAEEPLERKS